MNRYEAEYKNMRACYIKTYLQNVLLMILAILNLISQVEVRLVK